MALLSIRELSVEYRTERGPLRAVDTVSLDLKEGETLGLAGESGCGKSTLAFSILRLLPPSARISGRIELDGENVVDMDDRTLRNYRWKSVSLVPQGSMNAFDPVRTIGSQIVEGIKAHESISKAEAWQRARKLLSSVGISEDRAKSFPWFRRVASLRRAPCSLVVSDVREIAGSADSGDKLFSKGHEKALRRQVRNLGAHANCPSSAGSGDAQFTEQTERRSCVGV